MLRPSLNQIPPSSASEPADASLPYDADEWERRLAEARARREQVLRARSEGPAPDAGEADRGLGEDAIVAELRRIASLLAEAKKAPAPSPELRPGSIRRDAAPPPPPSAANTPQAIAAPARPRPAADRRRRFGPTLLGLAAGCMAGAVIASLSGVGDGIAELGNRLIQHSPVTLSWAPEAAQDATAGAVAPEPTTMEGDAPRVQPVVSEAPAAIDAPAAPGMPAERSGPNSAALAGDVPRAVLFTQPDPPPFGGVPFVAGYAAARATPAPVPPLQQVRPDVRDPATHVIVHVPNRAAPDRGNGAVATLLERDWRTQGPVTASHSISETQVRYYHPGDRAAAEELASLFDAEPRDFTDFTPPPEEGLLELWLSGEGAAPVAAKKKVRTPPPGALRAPEAVPDPLDRIVEDMRSLSYGQTAGSPVAAPGPQASPAATENAAELPSLGSMW